MKIALLLFLLSVNAFGATGPSDCGLYDIYGRVLKSKSTPGEFQYIVHDGTVSEYKFNLTDTQEIKLVPYFDKPSKIRARLSKQITDFNGDFSDIESVEDTIPDPAGLTKLKGFILIKKEKCQ